MNRPRLELEGGGAHSRAAGWSGVAAILASALSVALLVLALVWWLAP